MAGRIVDDGLEDMLKASVNHTAGEALVLRLHQNNPTITAASVAGDFTEATFTGYAAVTLTGGSWVVSGTDPTTCNYPQVTFTCGADSQDQDIYGYYITRTTSGRLYAAENFTGGAVNVDANGDLVKITPETGLYALGDQP